MEKIITTYLSINCHQCPFYHYEYEETYYCTEADEDEEGSSIKIPGNCPLRKSPIIVRLKDDL